MYENNKREPTLQDLERIAKACRITLQELVEFATGTEVLRRSNIEPTTTILSAQPPPNTSEVHHTIARLYSELGMPMIDIEAMKRAYRAVDKLFATRPGFGPDVKAVVLAAAYEETLRDAEAAETAVKDAMQRLTQGSNVKKRRTRAPK